MMALGEEPIHAHDVHVTILDLSGLNDESLTDQHPERIRKLTDFGGTVICEMIP
jgi:hypothetical protein